MLNKEAILLSLSLLISFIRISAQDLPPCLERDFIAEFPRVSPTHYCIELAIVADSEADRSYTSMVFTDDGTLYATHPYRGQVVALNDSDSDFLPDSESIIAENLRFPNGITLHNDILYILGDGIVYTIDNGVLETLVDDLPHGRGFLARGMTIHENMLYIAIPSPCDFCEGDDPLHGTVIRMQLDGTEHEVIARGLRYPAAIEFYQDALWVTDSTRDAYGGTTFYDEINRIDFDDESVPHFGFPYCVGRDNAPDLIADFDCTSATAPTMTLRTHSTPFALTHYDSDTFLNLSNKLMVVATGSNNSSFIAGHSLFAFEQSDENFLFETIAPADNFSSNGFLPILWQQDNGYDIVLNHSEFVNNQAGGIYPHFPYDVAVSPEGWLYLSVGGTGIYVLRPQT